MAFFHQFYEPLARIDPVLLSNFAKWVSTENARKLVLNRNEFCFESAGKLICPLHQAKIQNDEAYEAVRPILERVNASGIPLLDGRVPFRIEISLLTPGGEVLEHQDQHLMHLLCERIHVPVITDAATAFSSRWFTDTEWTNFRMFAGGIYRLNNRTPHKVRNDSSKYRVHVIIDYIRAEILEQYRDNLDELDDRYIITTASDAYWYKGPQKDHSLHR